MHNTYFSIININSVSEIEFKCDIFILQCLFLLYFLYLEKTQLHLHSHLNHSMSVISEKHQLIVSSYFILFVKYQLVLCNLFFQYELRNVDRVGSQSTMSIRYE